jgi:plastocyanin
MATIPLEFWIQIENHPWDCCPNKGFDRMEGRTIQEKQGANPIDVKLISPETGATHKTAMFLPVNEGASPDGTEWMIIDALILRRYKPPQKQDGSDAWTVPDDRKVNPWDLNEPDPTDSGTMGTIPGPVIECSVGDKVLVHFRNRDQRAKTTIGERTHSLHPHGFVFETTSDGAYPLSPADPTQSIKNPTSDQVKAGSKDETCAWAKVNVTGQFKQGDRVPPDGSFTYTWIAGAPSEGDPNAIDPWPTTAGVWLYHDHSICDMDNINLGAIGIIVIHNPDDPQDVDIRDPQDRTKLDPAFLPGGSSIGSPVTDDRKFYQTLPDKALFLLLFHELQNGTPSDVMCINGRKYMGNAPTLVARTARVDENTSKVVNGTLMRFGVVGMGKDFHTFHIHGHRWVIPGPDGDRPGGGGVFAGIQFNPAVKAVSQFEDTRLFGPANSFLTTIQEGTFMGARDSEAAVGEWHLHCHVLDHMEMGMMGSLVVQKSGAPFTELPAGDPSIPCPKNAPMGNRVIIGPGNRFDPPAIEIKKGEKVLWINNDSDVHTVTSNPGTLGCAPASNEPFSSPVLNRDGSFEHTFSTLGTFAYHCEQKGCNMAGTVTVVAVT